jgi:hypothetical protein
MNLPAGGVEELVPYELFRVMGFDIASASLEKPGILEGMNAIADYLLKVDDAHPFVTITGLESQSRIPGDVFSYGWNRAHAVEKFLRERTKNRPRAPIGYSTNTMGSIWSAPASASPYVKVYWRAATIQIKLSGKSWPGVNREHGFAPQAPEPEDENLLKEGVKQGVKEGGLHVVGHHLLSHGGPALSLAVFQIEGLMELAKVNQAGKMAMFRNMYEVAFEKALDELADEDPRKRHIDHYASLPRIDVDRLEQARVSVLNDPGGFKWLRNAVEDTARSDAFAYVASLSQADYFAWAKARRGGQQQDE